MDAEENSSALPSARSSNAAIDVSGEIPAGEVSLYTTIYNTGAVGAGDCSEMTMVLDIF